MYFPSTTFFTKSGTLSPINGYRSLCEEDQEENIEKDVRPPMTVDILYCRGQECKPHHLLTDRKWLEGALFSFVISEKKNVEEKVGGMSYPTVR